VIVTVLVIPLTVTMLSLQATVLFSPMPEMMRLLPGGGAGEAEVDGAADVDGAGDLVRVVSGPREALLGGLDVAEMAELMVDRASEILCATKKAMPPARTRKMTTINAPTIHHPRLPEGGFGGGPDSGPPP
jgi:hypothetical protein